MPSLLPPAPLNFFRMDPSHSKLHYMAYKGLSPLQSTAPVYPTFEQYPLFSQHPDSLLSPYETVEHSSSMLPSPTAAAYIPDGAFPTQGTLGQALAVWSLLLFDLFVQFS